MKNPSRHIIMGTNRKKAAVDSLEYLVDIDVEHHEVHSSNFYTMSDRFSGVQIATPKQWLVRTPNTDMRFHCKMNLQSTSASFAQCYENPFVSNSGTLLTAFNNDRNSLDTTTMQFFKDPVISGVMSGVLLQSFDLAAGLDKKIGGQARRNTELILKQNEDYLVRVVAGTNKTSISFVVEGYEVT